MNHSHHLIDLERIYYFKSAKKKHESSRAILPGDEEVEVVLKGYGEYADGEVRERVEPGAIIWLTEGDDTISTPEQKEPYECMVFKFTVSEKVKPPVEKPVYWRNLQNAKDFCWKALRDFHRTGIDRKILAEHLFSKLLFEAFHGDQNIVHENRPHVLKLALEMIESEFDKIEDVEDLAKRCMVSPSHLRLLFRKHLEKSPSEVLKTIRMNKAKEMLASGSKRVKEISCLCAYHDVVHFCRSFKKWTGHTPTEYRKIYAE